MESAGNERDGSVQAPAAGIIAWSGPGGADKA
jgi:hypothetical protein